MIYPSRNENIQWPSLLEPCPAMYYKSLSKASGGLGGCNVPQAELIFLRLNSSLVKHQLTLESCHIFLLIGKRIQDEEKTMHETLNMTEPDHPPPETCFGPLFALLGEQSFRCVEVRHTPQQDSAAPGTR